MPLLRLHQFAEEGNRYRVVAEYENGGVRRSAESRFELQLTAQDQEDIRWYLEDFLQYPMDPAPAIAARIERRMVEIGADLFTTVLGNTPVWQEARHDLSVTRIEIETTVKDATALPWELMRDLEADVPLALRARAFVRATHDSAQRPKLPQSAGGPIRVLLVICRPRGRDDVPFRSVARRMLEGLRGSDAVRLTVLRPPTFERLAHVLREAQAAGAPYHLVHFDGHGVWSEHGYLEFENQIREGNRQLVGGPALGNLLAETGVAALVLNACQSAYVEPPSQPVTVAPDNPHQETRAFGSLAQEIMDAGTAGVVAMRYNVFVDTAAQFVAKLYERLAEGDSLGEAASFARKQLNDQPLRGIAFDPRPLQDWMVPVVFEAEPVALFPRRKGKGFSLSSGAGAEVEGLPPRPDAGFIGRDETLLALDRAFDEHAIVLLHAYAGSGKTTAAAEFARWYRETGGIAGPVLFTSFEHYRSLLSVLNDLAGAMNVAQDWFALDEAKRRSAALQLLRQRSVLWIWDNVEPVAGFPKGSESSWSAPEQRELADFLRAARETKAKFLLTSRRKERDWLGDLPARVDVPPMPFQERLELARALASKHGRRLTDVEDWRPLLEFTEGNPLTIMVLVGEALRDGLHTREQVEEFVARLRAGGAALKDEATQGRTRSLAASLNYGFEHAFTEDERKQLALLHLFQGFVDVDALRHMADITRDAGIQLLDRAAEVGLLTAHGAGYYSIHPALPWFFRGLFEQQDTEAREGALRLYVEAIASLGDYYAGQYEQGNREVTRALKAEEPNLLHARAVARQHGWWSSVTSAMQGLRTLYDHTGRAAEWARLVEEIVPDFVDPATEGPLPGREGDWGFVSDYRVRLAREGRKWDDAERLQPIRVERDRRLAREGDRNSIRTLAVSLHELGEIQREIGRPKCADAYRESFDLLLRIGDHAAAGGAAFNLGRAYQELSALRNLDEAERWYRKSLEVTTGRDRMSRARCLGQLGSIAHERFMEARAADKPGPELLRHLNDTLAGYLRAFEMTPPDAVDQLAVTHGALGNAYAEVGDFVRALHHHSEAIRLQEAVGNLYGAAQTRYNVAITLTRARQFADARQYAEAALRDYQTFGVSAAQDVQDTLALIARLAKATSA